jgi:hypothetical protein
LPSPCTNSVNGGSRADDRDFESVDVALCPAAFIVPGVDAASQCGRAPGPTGVDARGNPCALVDNCAQGWHICDEADLARAEIVRPRCAEPEGFFVAATQGLFTSGGTPVCSLSGDQVVVGCGGGRSDGVLTGCNVLDRALVGGTCAAGFEGCALDPADGGSAAPATVPVYARLTRPNATARGGVLCCRDVAP